MAGYTMHAGNALEVAPRGQQANYRGNPEWCASPADSLAPCKCEPRGAAPQV